MTINYFRGCLSVSIIYLFIYLLTVIRRILHSSMLE